FEALRVATGSDQVGLALAHGAIPLAVPLDETNVRFDVTGIAVGSDAVWLSGDAMDRRLFRLDPATGRVVAAAGLPVAPSPVAVGPGGGWGTGPRPDR